MKRIVVALSIVMAASVHAQEARIVRIEPELAWGSVTERFYRPHADDPPAYKSRMAADAAPARETIETHYGRRHGRHHHRHGRRYR